MRVNRFEQRLRKTRELGIELEMNPCGQPGEAFEQTFDVGVRASLFRLTVKGQTPGDFRILAGELAAHFSQVSQLGAVKAEQTFIHALSLPRCNVRFRYPAWS